MATNFLVNGKTATTNAPRFSQVSWPDKHEASWLTRKRPIVATASPFVAGFCCNEVCDLRRLAKKVSQFLLQKPIRIGHTVMLA